MSNKNTISFWPRTKTGAGHNGWIGFAAGTVVLCAIVFAVLFWNDSPRQVMYAAGVRDSLSARFDNCSGPVRTNCVVDGDTFWFQGRKIRIADINTPETAHAQCASERQLGERAKDRLRILLNTGAFTLAANPDGRDQDKYGRDLRIVTRSGKSLGAVLVTEGLAEEWQGYRRQWC